MGKMDSFTPGSDVHEEDIGRQAEQAVLEALMLIPGMEARHATEEEDSGREDIVKGDAIDVVVYAEGKPSFWIQVTTAKSRQAREEKISKFVRRPLFKRVEGTAIPRTMVFVDPQEVKAYTADHDISKHAGLRTKIMDDLIGGMSFALSQTKLADERGRIEAAIAALQNHRATL